MVGAGSVSIATCLRVERPPAVIAHRGGNSEGRAEEALHRGADLLEVDLWSHRRRLEARHERRILHTPVLYERWYLGWSARNGFTLPDLLQLTAGKAGVLLDFKNRHHAPELIREAFRSVGESATVAASSQLWHVLRTVHEVNPRVELFYSIDVRSQLDLFLSVVERDARPTGVSCNHRHLDEALANRFRQLGLAVIAWTVDDPERAVQLAGWGVDAITTNRVAPVLASLRGR
jgi:glycerophosphoryl diester phosphodiesterase